MKTGSGISEEDNAFELGGLPQGCPMSPVLWAIVADFAISFASKHGGKGYDFGQVLPDSDDTVEVRFMAYADDLICISDTKAGLEQTVQSMTTILSCFNIRLSPKKCVYMWSRKAHEDLMSRRGNLGDIDIRGLELVSMKPRANGKKTREGTPTTVGVVGKTAKHKRDTFEIDWTDECTQQGKNSARPKFLTWDQIGKRVGPKALQGREIVIEDEDEKEVMARIHGRQSDGPNAKYDVTVAGTTKKITMTWALKGEALAKRREMDVRMVALEQSGRLESMT